MDAYRSPSRALARAGSGAVRRPSPVPSAEPSHPAGPVSYALYFAPHDAKIARRLRDALRRAGHTSAKGAARPDVDLVLVSNATDADMVAAGTGAETVFIVLSTVAIPADRVAFHRRHWIDHRMQDGATLDRLARWLRDPGEGAAAIEADPTRLDRTRIPLIVGFVAVLVAIAVAIVSAAAVEAAVAPDYNPRALPPRPIAVLAGLAAAVVGSIIVGCLWARSMTFGFFVIAYGAFAALLAWSVAVLEEVEREVWLFVAISVGLVFALGAWSVWSWLPARWLRSSRRRRLTSRSVAVVTAGRAARTLAVAAAAAVFATGGNVLWLSDDASSALTTRIRVPAEPIAVAVGEGAVWVLSQGGSVSRIDPRRRELAGATIRVGRGASEIAAGEGSVWVLDGDGGRLWRIDPRRHAALGPPTRVAKPASSVAAGEGGVWVLDYAGGRLARLDPRTMRFVRRGIAVGPYPLDVAIGHGAVWATSEFGRSVVRIDPRRNRVTNRVRLMGFASDLAVTSRGVWATLREDHYVARINPRTGQVKRMFVAVTPRVLVAGRDALWG